MKPIIKWAGGKNRLSPKILSLLPKKKKYIEPFVGGGAIFWQYEAEEYTIADTNQTLIDMYRAIKSCPDFVILQLKKFQAEYNQNPEETFVRLKHRFNTTSDTQEKIPLFIFLNKTCFNGLWRVNRKGEFNVGWCKKNIIALFDEKNIRQCIDKLQKTKILHSDFRDIEADEDSVIYCDPPYLPVNKTSNFVGYTKEGFSLQDHIDLYKKAIEWKKQGAFVLISNSSTPEIIDLYRYHTVHEIMAARAINSKGDKRGKIKELLIEF